LKLTEENVRYVAGLANLTLSDQEIHQYTADLSGILSHMEKLNQLDTSHVEPVTQVLFAGQENDSLREDIEHTPLSNDVALANAPLAGAGYFKVPKVIER